MARGRSSHSSRLWHTMLPAVKEPRQVPARVFSSEVEATLLRAQRLQQLDDLLSLEVLCPSERGGPVYGISGRQVRSALDEQFHHPDAPSARRPMERSPSPVEARRLRVDVGTAVEQIRSSLDAAAEDRVDQRLLQALVGWRFSEHWSVYRWVMASRTRQQTAISVKEAREQIGPSHACGKFQVQGGALPHKSLSNLRALIPDCLGERTPVITQSIHRRACVDEELGQDGIVAARSPLQSCLSFLWVARAGIDVRSGNSKTCEASLLLVILFHEAGCGNHLSHGCRFLEREEQRAWMIRKPDRGSLLRPEQEGLFAEGRAHALAALSRDDERHHARRGGQIQDFARGGGDKGNRMACDRAGRLDMCGFHERRRKQHGIKGTPGKEGLSVHLEAMACRHQGHAPAEDVALLVKLRIGQLPQSSLQFVLVELEPRP